MAVGDVLENKNHRHMNHLEKSIINKAYNYESYKALIAEKFANHKTTGPDHSEAMLNYTSLNMSRMKRLDKKSRLTEETKSILKKIKEPITWLVITEGWCGDAAQIVPVLQHMALENTNIDLRFILRDQNLPIIDAFLTNNARSIPKVIFLNSNTLEVLDSWGPRPSEVQKMVMDAKTKAKSTEDLELKKKINEEASKQLHLWYAKDKTLMIQQELCSLLSKIF